MIILFLIIAIFSVSLLFYGVVLTVHAQSDLETTKHRDMVIDLGNGLKTNARLNLPTNGDSDNHVSYHKDGSVWYTFNGLPRKVAQFEPLSSFKGIHNMFNAGFSNDLNKRAMPEYMMKKLDYVVYIDARSYKKIPNINSINCTVYILEPKRYDLLSGPTEFHGREIHLYPLFDPWIVISVLGAPNPQVR